MMEKNYKALTKLIPDIAEILTQKDCVGRLFSFRENGFYDLDFMVLSKNRGKYSLCLGYYYILNGDRMRSPEYEFTLDLKNGTCTPTSFFDDSVGMYAYKEEGNFHSAEEYFPEWMDQVRANHGAVFPLDEVLMQSDRNIVVLGNRVNPNNHNEDEYDEIAQTEYSPEPAADEVQHPEQQRGFTLRDAIDNNLNILQKAVTILDEKREAFEDERALLGSFRGLGTISDLVLTDKYPDKKDKFWELAYRLAELSGVEREDVRKEVEQSLSNMFFTPSGIGSAVLQAIESNTNLSFVNILEPAMGIGNMVQDPIERGISVTGVEMNFISAAISKLLYPAGNLRVNHTKLEEYALQGEPHDLIITNVPFSTTKVFDPSWMENSEKEKDAFTRTLHGYYFAKSLDLLASGGVMAFIAPTGIMDSDSQRELRSYLMEQADFITAVRMPDNTFENTQVTADLIMLQKRPAGVDITEETRQRNAVFIGKEQIELLPDGAGDTIRFNISPWYLSAQGSANVLGSWKVGRMHGGYNLAVQAADHFSQEQLTNSIAEAIRKAAGSFKPLRRNPVQQYSAYQRADNTPEERMCEANFNFLASVRNGLKYEDILKGWHKVNEQYSGLSAGEKDHYRHLWNEVYRDKVNDFAQEKAIVKISDLVYKSVNSISNGVSDLDIESSFNKRITSLLADGIIPPGKFPAQLYTLSRIAQSEDGLPSLFPSVRFLGHAQNLFGILDKIHDQENSLLDVDIDTPILAALRKKALDLYSSMTEQGTLYSGSNMELIKDYFPPAHYNDFRELEQKDEQGQVVLADIFKSFQERRGDLHYSDRDWLLKCLNRYGGVNKAYLDIHTQGGLEKLRAGGTIFRIPGTDTYEMAEKYLCGNVKKKLAEARQAQAQGEQDLGLNISELERIIPKDKTIQEIAEVVNLGERWISIGYFRDFVRNHLNIKAEIFYDKYGDQYFFEEDKDGRGHNEQEGWRLGPRWNADKILEKAFSHTYPFVTTTKVVTVAGVTKTVEFPDEKATKKGAMLIEKIRTEWKAYCLSNLNFRDFLFREYNERFNNTVLPHFDGSALTFDDMVGKEPYPTQKNAIWRCLQSLDGDGIFDHYVGAGKSLVMSGAAHELNRIGRTKRVLITGLVANIKEIYQEHRKVYPNDKVLYIDRKYGNSNRAEMLAKIRNGDWDVVFMPHTQFGLIPHDKEIMTREIQTQIDSIGEELKNHSLSKKQKKGLIMRQKNFKVILDRAIAQIKKDAGLPTFKELGFDYLMADESHIFKNLGFATKHGYLAGIGNAQGSQRALNMLFACRTLQQKWGRDTGIAFFSGTPVSNSLTEIYSLQRYLCPSKLKDRGMYSLDAWLTTFGLITTEYEINVAGTIAPKERLRGIMKADQLVKDYWMMADVVLKTDENVTSKAPKLDAELVKLPPTPVQEVFNDLFLAFTQVKEAGDADWLAPLLFDDPGKFIGEGYLKAKMVVVASMAKQCSIHMGLRRSDMTDFYSPKVEAMTERVMKYYKESDRQRGVQIVFSNVGTPSASNEEKGFNVYDCIRERLTREGIPENEIVFIHDFDTDAKRDKLFEQVNNGKYRIVLGSTEKLGTGVNIQQRCVCLHHVDIPWRPDEVEQRNGRGARQGNWLADSLYDGKVKSYFYATEKMLDVLQYNLLDIKQSTKDVLHNPLAVGNIFKIDDKADDGTPSFDEYVADLSGDNDMLKKVKLEKQIEDSEYRYRLFLDKKANLEQQLNVAQLKVANTRSNIDYLNKEKDYLTAQMEKAEIPTVNDLKMEFEFDLSVIGKDRFVIAGNDQIGTILLEVMKNNHKNGEHVLASFLGFDLVATREFVSTDISQMNDMAVNGLQIRNKETGLNYRISPDARRTERTAGLWIKNTLFGILLRPGENEYRLEREIKTQESYQAQLDAYPKEFPESLKIPEMKVELKELEKRILKNGAKTVQARIDNIDRLRERYEADPLLFIEDMRALDAQTRQKAGVAPAQTVSEEENERKNVKSKGAQASLF